MTKKMLGVLHYWIFLFEKSKGKGEMQMLFSLIPDTLLQSALRCFAQNWTTNIPHTAMLMRHKREL